MKKYDKCHRKRSKKLLNLLRVLGGKLTLAPPPYVTRHIFFRQTQGFGFSGVKSKILWQFTTIRAECHLPPPLPRARTKGVRRWIDVWDSLKHQNFSIYRLLNVGKFKWNHISTGIFSNISININKIKTKTNNSSAVNNYITTTTFDCLGTLAFCSNITFFSTFRRCS